MRQHGTGLLVAILLLCAAVPSQAAGPWRASQSNTRGWQLMTPQERIEHQSRVRGFTDYGACEAYRTRHHDLMAERARERDLTLNDNARDFCDHLKLRGGSPSGSN